MCAGGRLKTSPMESVHAGEYIKLLTKQSLETFFTLVTGINLDASIFDHPQLIFELLGVSRITIHQLFESTYFSGVAFQTLTNLVFETLDFNVLVEVRKQVLYFNNFALFGKLYHIAYPSFLYQKVFGNLYPKLFPLVLVLRLISILLSQILFVMFESQSHSFSIEIHFSIDYDLRVYHFVSLEKSQTKIKIKI
jgi:hypothetical protein